MQSEFSYCFVIRTLGMTGKKYQALLDSIKSQTVQPKDVFVVLANGYSEPPEKLGYETFLFTSKGMWNQRIFGIEYANNIYLNKSNSRGGVKQADYQIVCDDDISFSPTFAEDIIRTAEQYDGDILIPHNTGNEIVSPSSKRKIRTIINMLLGQRYISKKSPYKITLAKTGGFIVNESLKNNVNPTQSGVFTCFLLKIRNMEDLHLYDESWLDKTKYSWPDDQVFFYKCFLNGYNIFHCGQPSIKHLDHGASNSNRRIDGIYASGKNVIIFWHRFLYLTTSSWYKHILLKFAILYRIIAFSSYYLIYSIVHKNIKFLTTYWMGCKDGFEYIKSQEYSKLHKVV